MVLFSWKRMIGTLLCAACYHTIVHADAEKSCPPPAKKIKDPLPEHISGRHTEGKGLGYSKGYTSLDLFLSQPFSQRRSVPFLDLRGHIFNDGKYAANAGLGFRYLYEHFQQIWGINAFYDYFQTSQRPYNQVGVGLEVLAEHWDARVNGYIPVGHKQTNIYRFHYEDLSLDNFLLVAREQFAMRGVDSEVGYRFCKTRYFDFHVGAGPYYYWGTSAKTENAFRETRRQAIGGRIKAQIGIMNYLFLDGYVGYDSLFRWTGQGTITLSLPFNFTVRTKKNCSNISYCLKERLFRPVSRNEIVTIDSCNRTSTDPDVLDPENKP
jgi:hypothetical protein